MGDNDPMPEFGDLSASFDLALNNLNELDNSDLPSNSVNFQKKVQETISSLERSTIMVNKLSLFSTNETIDDVTSANLKYLLLPALLGYLHVKLTGKDRLRCVQIADIYFKDFLKRVKSYEVCPIPIELEDGEEEVESTSDGKDGENVKVELAKRLNPIVANVEAQVRERNAKIENYRRQKELEEKLDSLKAVLDGEDAEAKREYYILLIKSWVCKSIEEIRSIEKEKEILSMMSKMGSKKPEPEGKPKSEPLKPFIITRTELQKKVFGLGYPAVPTMSIEEFVDIKIKEGDLTEQKPGQSNSLMEWAQNPDLKKQQDEDDAEIKEKADETEDAEALQRARGWDEFKDDNKRGWGNRYNRS